MAEAVTTDTPVAEKQRLLDLRLRCRSGVGAMLAYSLPLTVGMSLALYFCLPTLFSSPTLGLLPTLVAVFASQELCGWLWHRLVLRRLRRLRAATGDMSAEDARQAVVETLEGLNKHLMMISHTERLTGRSVLDEAAAILCDRGYAGTAIRFSPDPSAYDRQPVPLNVRFEPMPLGLKRPEIDGVTDGNTTRRRSWSRFLNERARLLGNSAKARALVILALAVSVVVIAWILVTTIWQLSTGRLPSTTTIIVWIAISLAGAWLVGLALPRQWLAVPGGLIVRTSSWRSARWQLHLMRRDESVLIYWENTTMIAVADSRGCQFTHRLRPAVADFAIRAWMSPLEPPAVERLSDLT